MNKSAIVNSVFVIALIVFLLAPFTFLKPGIKVDDEKSAKSTKSTPKVIVKKVEEKPLHQVKLPDFASIRDIKTKKKAFFDFIRPAIEKENTKLLTKRARLEFWLEKISLGLPLSDSEMAKLSALVTKYKVNKKASVLQQVNELLVRIDVVPTELVLVQAANESAWGTSRFSRIGLNFFGIWCYREGCGMVPGGRNTGAKHEVAAFQSVDDAVARYFYNINSHNAYSVFRTIRFELRSQHQPLNPEVLATGLLAYSERGSEYVTDLTKMLRQNQQFFKAKTENKEIPASE